jgi:glycosyltransferase involved in cell wall biosynthesis
VRILFLNHNVIWRSTFFRCLQFGKQLVANGHSVDLLTISPKARLRFAEREIEGVHVIESPDLLFSILRTGWDPYDTLRRRVYLKPRHYDLIHAFDCRPAVILPALAQRSRDGATLLTDWADWWGRGGVIDERPNRLIKLFFERTETYFEEHYRTQADGLTVISQALRDRAMGLGVRPEVIARIYSGADTERIQPMDKAAARASLGLPVDAPIVGFTGFVHYDLALLLAAFDLLAQQRPNVRLLITGKPSPLVRQYAERGHWSDRVFHAGIVPYADLPRYLAAADLNALPFADKQANRGRWPNKLGDYLSAGRPVVSNPTGDIQDLFTRYDIGALTEGTPAAFARGMTDLLDDPARALAQGAAARQVAEHELSWPKLTQQLEEHYNSVRDSGRPQREEPTRDPDVSGSPSPMGEGVGG